MSSMFKALISSLIIENKHLERNYLILRQNSALCLLFQKLTRVKSLQSIWSLILLRGGIAHCWECSSHDAFRAVLPTNWLYHLCVTTHLFETSRRLVMNTPLHSLSMNTVIGFHCLLLLGNQREGKRKELNGYPLAKNLEGCADFSRVRKHPLYLFPLFFFIRIEILPKNILKHSDQYLSPSSSSLLPFLPRLFHS